MDRIAYLSSELHLRPSDVKGALALMDEGATIPFIARYRRERTGDMSDETLRKLADVDSAFQSLESRRKTILESLAKQNISDPGLLAAVAAADTLASLEDIYRPYRPKRETRASRAQAKGLDKLLDYIFSDRTNDYRKEAERFVCSEYKTAQDCIQGALDIWAERIADRAVNRRMVRDILGRKGSIEVTLVKDAPLNTFDSYDGMRISLYRIQPHQVLAINRGVKEKCLRIAFTFPETEIESAIERMEKPAGFQFPALLSATVKDSCERLLFPSVEKETFNDLLDRAKDSSLGIFAKGVKEVLLAPPLKPQTVLGFDPGYAHGCKIAVIDQTGKVLDTAVVFPTIPNDKKIAEADRKVSDLIAKYKVGTIALGNGTASRESFDFLSQLIRDHGFNTSICIVSEAGASVYSATELAVKEFPDFDINLRSAVSIARRLLDPLAELVKIPPESLGVGQYQHDLDEKKLQNSLAAVVEDCVSAVGVDLNTASPTLLSHVSGLNSRSAKSLVDYREKNGAFTSRQELSKVKNIGPKALQNAAGFLRIKGSEPLDDTFIHPESYTVARRAMKLLHISDSQSAQQFLKSEDKESMQQACHELGTDIFTLQQIISELAVPHRDPRGEFKPPVFDSRIRDIKDLKEGMILEGTVRNIVAYGAYVDLGLHKDGMIHISEISTRRLSSPSEVLAIGQVVKVMVIGVDLARNRISLSLKRVPETDK